MQVFLFRAGQQHGPYSVELFQAMGANGQLLADDLAAFDGSQEWVPVQQALEQTRVGGFEKYNRFSETVGGLSLRWKDNVIQLGAVIFGVCAGMVVGFLMYESMQAALIGATIGMTVMVFLSGIVLGILRRFRKGD